MIFNQCQRLKTRSGSLLIESLLAVVILSVSITIVVQSITASMRATVHVSDYTKALLLVEDEMFAVMEGQFIEAGLSEENTFEMPYENFKSVLKTSLSDMPDQKNINDVSLTVSWKNRVKNNSLKIQTYLFNPADEE